MKNETINNIKNNAKQEKEYKQISGLKIDIKAIEVAQALYSNKNDHNLNLRVAIKGGGCSGFLYEVFFDDQFNSEQDFYLSLDHKKQNNKNQDAKNKSVENNLYLVVDSLSMQFMMGAWLTFQDDLNGSGFDVINPNASKTCGCGQSFSV